MRAEVFAVDDTTVQVCWAGAGDHPIEVEARWAGGTAGATTASTEGASTAGAGGSRARCCPAYTRSQSTTTSTNTTSR